VIRLPLPEFDLEQCDGCAYCVEACPEQVLHLVTGRPQLVAEADCAYCGLCEDACPVGAITLVYEIVIGGAR
jgi:NAD-dependent dihydropyrimidine dehydrogenase PreA subunit